MQRRLIWSRSAFENFKKALIYIDGQSPQNALKVELAVLSRLQHVLNYPESCSPDKYRTDNTEMLFRAFELHGFRVSYFIGREEIRIIRFRGTKMKPRYY